MALRIPGEVSRRQLFGRFRDSETQFRPPWAKSAEAFVESCTRCHACIDACPEKIIVSGRGRFPIVKFGKGHCTFCGACAEACADNCFSTERTPSKAWSLTAAVSSYCIEAKGISCRLCGEACDTAAIRFQPRAGGGSTIHFNERCTGCGACLPLCPVSALSMIAAEVHA